MIDMKEILEKYKSFLLARKQSLNYYNVMKIFLSYLEEKKIEISNITQETITEFFIVHSEYSSNTRNQYIKAGRSFYRFMNIEDNEWKKIKLMAVEHKIPDFLSPEEVEQGKKYLKTYHSNKYSIPKIEGLLSFLYATGVRKQELLNLKRVDFDLENNKAKVFGKGKKERLVYFNNKVKKDIVIYFDSEVEIINAFNITLGKLHYIVRLMSKYLGKKVYLHLLRHSSARQMIMKDIPLNIVSKILGHSSIQTTLRYTDPSEKMIADKYKEKMK